MAGGVERKQIFLWLCFGFILTVFINAVWVYADDSAKKQQESLPVAVGDGIVVTMQDVTEVMNFFNKGIYRLTPEGYRKNAIMLRLFAEEAKNMGMECPPNKKEDSFEGKKTMGDLYTAKLLRDHKIDDAVIQSYYDAHPNEFEDYDEKTGEHKIQPLDDTVRESIHQKMVLAKKMRIQDDAYEYLKTKYNVRMCDEGGCAK